MRSSVLAWNVFIHHMNFQLQKCKDTLRQSLRIKIKNKDEKTYQNDKRKKTGLIFKRIVYL